MSLTEEQRTGSGDTLVRAVLDTLGTETVVVDREGRIVDVTAAWRRRAGGDGGIGRAYLGVVAEVFGPVRPMTELADTVEQVVTGGSTGRDVELRTDAVPPGWIDVHIAPLAGPWRGAVVTHFDRAGRHVGHDATQTSSDVYRSVIDSVEDTVFQTDASGRWTFLNAAWERLTGYPVAESVGRSYLDFVPPNLQGRSWERFTDTREHDAAHVDEVELTRRDGGRRAVEVRSHAVFDADGRFRGKAGTIVDVTERRLREVELRHVNKLEAVGRLAAGIAHEINTPIQFVGDNVEFLGDACTDLVALLGKYRRSVRPDGSPMEWRERVDELMRAETDTGADYLEQEIPRAVADALEGVKRVASIVRAMKAFGHPDLAEQEATDLNEAVRNTLTVARNEYKYVADVVTELGELPAVVCYPGDVNQALLNLLVNAAHAIGDQVGRTGRRGTISITTALDGDDAVVTVADTGTGIPDDVRLRIFDPFFTTKEVGRGTGQGLSLVRSIVEKHRGTVSFESVEGEGTTFTLRLPVRGSGR